MWQLENATWTRLKTTSKTTPSIQIWYIHSSSPLPVINGYQWGDHSMFMGFFSLRIPCISEHRTVKIIRGQHDERRVRQTTWAARDPKSLVREQWWLWWLYVVISCYIPFNVNPGLINHGLLIGGGTPPIVIIWYLNGTHPIKQPRGLLIQGWDYIGWELENSGWWWDQYGISSGNWDVLSGTVMV